MNYKHNDPSEDINGLHTVLISGCYMILELVADKIKVNNVTHLILSTTNSELYRLCTVYVMKVHVSHRNSDKIHV